MSDSEQKNAKAPQLRLNQVAMLNEGETIIQIMPFNGTLACLTSSGRVLAPGPQRGEWFEIPIPPPFSPTGH